MFQDLWDCMFLITHCERANPARSGLWCTGFGFWARVYTTINRIVAFCMSLNRLKVLLCAFLEMNIMPLWRGTNARVRILAENMVANNWIWVAVLQERYLWTHGQKKAAPYVYDSKACKAFAVLSNMSRKQKA